MNTKWSLSLWIVDPNAAFRGGVSEDVFRNFAGHVPDLVNESELSFSTGLLVEDDPIIPRLLQALSNCGIDIHGNNNPPQFSINIHRSYSESDLNYCEYLARGHVDVGLGKFMNDSDERGIPFLSWAITPLSRDFGTIASILAKMMLVRDAAKKRFETSNLKHLTLVKPTMDSKRLNSVDDSARIIWSDFILPPVKNLCTDGQGRYFKYSPENQIAAITEGPFMMPTEPHYLRSDISLLGNFDIAIMRELTKRGTTSFATLVYSKRFREFVNSEFGMEMKGIPVRIDDDKMIPWSGPYPGPLAHLNKRPEWLSEFERNQ